MARIRHSKSVKKDKVKAQANIEYTLTQSQARHYPLYASYYRTGLRLVGEVVSLCVAELKRKATRKYSHIIYK